MKSFMTLGVITRGYCSTEWAFTLKDLELPPATQLVKIQGLPFDHARNQLVKHLMRNESHWLFMLDDDVHPPKEAITKLLSHRKEIVSGFYWKRQGQIVPTAYQETGWSINPISSWPDGALMEVDFVAAGCLLVHRAVFDTVKAPWFEWRLDREDLPSKDRLGEDFTFCSKARQAGYRIHLDTSVRCRHVGEGQADDLGRFGPLPNLELL